MLHGSWLSVLDFSGQCTASMRGGVTDSGLSGAIRGVPFHCEEHAVLMGDRDSNSCAGIPFPFSFLLTTGCSYGEPQSLASVKRCQSPFFNTRPTIGRISSRRQKHPRCRRYCTKLLCPLFVSE